MPTKCNISKCSREAAHDGLCASHRQSTARYGKSVFGNETKCSIAGCERLQRALGRCATHEKHFRQMGTDEYRPRIVDRKAHRKAYAAKWKRDNRVRLNALIAQRKARVKQATPGWADKKAIAEFYMRTPPGHHVDHIIPLNGNTVGGLHVLSNLQYLPGRANMSKGAKFTPVAFDPFGLLKEVA